MQYYFVDDNDKCMANCKLPAAAQQYPHHDIDCGNLDTQPNSECWGGNICTEDCYRTEDTANNFIGLRTMPNSTFGDKLCVPVCMSAVRRLILTTSLLLLAIAAATPFSRAGVSSRPTSISLSRISRSSTT
jgi:hypothetical protein